jgi:ribonucleotide reductase alpha subunit
VRKKARLDANLNETLSRVFSDIESSANGADSEDDLKGLFDDLDVNSAKLGNTVAQRNERLVKLLDGISNLKFGRYEDNSIDAFGAGQWDDAVQLGEQYGYRNAQATVIAPTGTIGLVMDCDTTGVEPDFALVKFKNFLDKIRKCADE